MKFILSIPYLSLVSLSLLLSACFNDSSVDSSFFGVQWCSLDVWNGHSKAKITAGSDDDFYVLDDFSKVFHYKRDPSRICAWNIDNSFGSFGEVSLNGFAEDMDYNGSSLYYYDGISLLRSGDDSFECAENALGKNFALSGKYLVSGDLKGLNLFELTASGCKKANVTFSGALRVSAIAIKGNLIATTESISTELKNPERLVVYDLNGFTPVRNALSGNENSEMYFCSASRLRFFNTGILLLDKECGKLGVFDLDGRFIKSLFLADFKIRAVEDMEVLGNEVYFLTNASFYLTYRVELAELLR